MTEGKPTIAIVGLGLIGCSIGMALRRAGVASQVVGHDREPAAAGRAKKAGAVDRTDWNLISACEKADLIILAIPLPGIRDTLRAIAPYLRENCVVVDTSSLKAPVLDWADELLPEQVHFVGLDPIVRGSAEGGVDSARPDLFENCLVCVASSSRASSEAVKLATDLISILGARPLFYDAAEHDGLAAAVEQLPPLLALALLETVMGTPVWREARKLAGTTFEHGTQLSQADGQALSEDWLANRVNVVRWLDGVISSLGSLRESLREGRSGELVERLKWAQEERGAWLHLRSRGDWSEDLPPPLPPKQSMLQPLFGGLWPRRRKPEQKP